MKMPIIALGRQFGSGGREIGKHLAEKLQVRCYDRELITLAAQKAEVREELFAGKEEKAPNPWLLPASMRADLRCGRASRRRTSCLRCRAR